MSNTFVFKGIGEQQMIDAQYWQNASKFERVVFTKLSSFESKRYKTELKEFEETGQYTPIDPFLNFEAMKIEAEKEMAEDGEESMIDQTVKTQSEIQTLPNFQEIQSDKQSWTQSSQGDK